MRLIENYVEENQLKELSQETKEKLVQSLSWETTELLPYLPYLLQDFWELGSDPEVMVELINKYTDVSENTKVLDLACGKGAVSVKVASELGIKVKGIDLMPEFIEFANQKAKEYNVDDLCNFVVDDINEAVKTEKDYDCVVFGAAGMNVFGGPAEALEKLKTTVKSGGFILIEEGYFIDESAREKIKYNSDAYYPLHYWMSLFDEANLKLVETASGHSEGDLDGDFGLEAITVRANELIEKHPEKRELFEGYVRNQQMEYADIDDSLTCVTWALQNLNPLVQCQDLER